MGMQKFVKMLFAMMVGLGMGTYSGLTSAAETHQFEVGAEVSYIKYEEPTVDVEEKGVMGGLYGGYTFRPEWADEPINVFHLDGHMNYGQVDYEGSGTIDNVDDFLVEPRAWVGKDLAVGDSTRVTPYAGIGYRLLYDALGGTISSTGAAGYDRRSQYLYAPVGVDVSTKLNEEWRIGFTAEYDFFIQGWQTSYLSDINGYADLENDQEEGYGVRGSINLVKTMEKFNLVISPYARYWNIEDSEIATSTGSIFRVTGFEPENESLETGLRVGVEF
jgi:hypothetical protein